MAPGSSIFHRRAIYVSDNFRELINDNQIVSSEIKVKLSKAL